MFSQKAWHLRAKEQGQGQSVGEKQILSAAASTSKVQKAVNTAGDRYDFSPCQHATQTIPKSFMPPEGARVPISTDRDGFFL